jgi:hypothetical protein
VRNAGYGDAPYQRGNNLTLIGAMALKGLIGEMTYLELPMDWPLTYVTQVLVPNLWQSRMCSHG